MVVEISVRLTEGAWERLQEISRVEGISIRSTFEAAFLCFLQCPGTPVEKRVRMAGWAVARRLDEEAATGKVVRRKVNVRVDDQLWNRLKDACQREGVSANGLAAAAFTPWGRGWGGMEEYCARIKLWKRCVATARRLDYERRTGRPIPPDPAAA